MDEACRRNKSLCVNQRDEDAQGSFRRHIAAPVAKVGIESRK
jgi:hypothetical protein